MLYLAIPAHNEVATIGVLLWRLRTVLAEFPREYEVVVYDDASSDDTAAVAEQYERAMPVTVLRGTSRLGYAGAVDALLRHIATRTRYPRRDAVLLLQGDFTDPPVIVPEFARRFEGGADLVVGERLTVADAPTAVKRLFKYGHWVMRPFVKVAGVADLTASMRLVRISALREAIRVAGDAPLVSGDSWTANADLLLRLAPHARRVESVPMEPTFGVRMRATRRVAMADTMAALRWAWGARGRKAVIGSSPAESGPDERRGPRHRRREEPELSVEKLREKVRERDGTRGIDGEPPEPRRGRRRERADMVERPARGERRERPERAERAERPARPERPDGTREPRAPRPEREVRAPEPRTEPSRGSRRRDDARATFADPTLELDDPFAPPAARRDTRATEARATEAHAPESAGTPAEAATGGEAMRNTAANAEGRAEASREDRAERPDVASPTAPGDGATGMNDVSAPASGAGADEEGADAESAEGLAADDASRPKRRRNRRSRRGRRRKSGVSGEDSAGEDATGEEAAGEPDTTEGEGEGGDEPGEGNRRGRPRHVPPVRFSPGDHVDGEPIDRRTRADEAEDDGDDDGDEVAGTESMSEGAPRSRRRGRRGRRGGARRSRGRKERGEGDMSPGSTDSE